ncbi:MAG: ATP-grasp domain-containing protein [Chloroflexota bacterium]
MKIIFCQDPMSATDPDSMYIDEVAAATRAGSPFLLIDYAAIADEDNAARAVRDVPIHRPVEKAIYRGWMLSAKQYAALYDALMSRGIQLISNATQYKHTHHLPESLHLIEDHTPQTIYVETDGKNISTDSLMQMLIPFSGQALVLKDYVKSAKHYWYQACYISSASDEKAVRNTVDHFLKLRGDDLEGGLVFREFIDFEALADHPRSRMPLVKEFRTFFYNGVPILTVRYWNVEGYEEASPPAGLFNDIAKNVKSDFFTMDVAQTVNGEWMIIELGDGQVAGLPETASVDDFYRALSGS